MTGVAVRTPKLDPTSSFRGRPRHQFGFPACVEEDRRGAPRQRTEANYRQLLDLYKMSQGTMSARNTCRSRRARISSRTTALMPFRVTGGVPTSAIMDCATSGASRFLPIEDTMLAILTNKYPFLSAAVIPANSYQRRDEQRENGGGQRVLIAHPKLSTDVVLQPYQGAVRESGRIGGRPCQRAKC